VPAVVAGVSDDQVGPPPGQRRRCWSKLRRRTGRRGHGFLRVAAFLAARVLVKKPVAAGKAQEFFQVVERQRFAEMRLEVVGQFISRAIAVERR
jgi:hypothetical protein